MRNRLNKSLYYITHIKNLPSIFDKGIFSHAKIEEKKIKYERIYNEEIVNNRRHIIVYDNKTLWDFANVYFQPRNPMMFRVICDKSPKDIAIISIKRNAILRRKDIFLTTGNAASSYSDIYPASQFKKAMSEIVKNTNLEYWGDVDGGKRKIMAECLVPDTIDPVHFDGVYVSNHDTAEIVKHSIGLASVPIIPEPNFFFEPYVKTLITKNLFLVEGDMFFSRMQTITVSVNCVGVMGKGLASRAKYQFPDVYVYYQDLCKRKELKMGKPHLYKREKSLEYEFADEPESLGEHNGETWFLLFPTKNDWKYKSDITGIEKGLQVLKNNYKEWGIKSLAIPALGCGLGWLSWKDVGPLLCKYLSAFDIQVWLYLPAEKRVDPKYLTKEFLLSQLA